MGVLEGVVMVTIKVVKDVHEQHLELNRGNRRLAKEVEASAASAVRAGKSPYEDDFRHASLQEVLSMLVDGVYHRDHSVSDLNWSVKPFIERVYKVDERMVHFTSRLYWRRMESISEKEEEDAGIKHYIRLTRNPNKSAPSLVIAIRGTKPRDCQDLQEDIKITTSTPHFRRRVKQGRDLIKKILEEYAKWQRGDYEDASSELASRSLGAPPGHQNVGCDVCNMVPILMDELCFLKHGSSNDYDMIDKPLGKSEPQLGRRRRGGYDDAESSKTKLELPISRVEIPSPVQHPGVACNMCEIKPIIGTRYKSNKKDEYNFCQKCFLKHGRIKDFKKIDKPLKNLEPEHPRVECDVCGVKPIIGYRYKSNKKVNYDLCQKCFLKHGNCKDYNIIHKPLEYSEPQHQGITCDVCGTKPIIGSRYKSKKKVDYDLCQKCFLKHGRSKDYTKIDEPPAKSEPEHPGVECDVCEIKPIIGPRYKSNKKVDYDLCHKCFLKHGSSKDFNKIDRPLGNSEPKHPGVGCDVCDIIPIIGPRYKSNKKVDYDLCQNCFLKHGRCKDFNKIDKPLGNSEPQHPGVGIAAELVSGYHDDDDDDSESDNDMNLVLSRPVPQPVQHPRVQCDICDTVPIVGSRYKSVKKHNYDLCQQCFQEHGALEDYTKIETPLESTSSGSTGDDIYITGHSLGAALALQIGKMLAAEEKQRALLLSADRAADTSSTFYIRSERDATKITAGAGSQCQELSEVGNGDGDA